MSFNVFKRYELKYLIDKKQYENIMKKSKNYLTSDSYGKSTIQSLYYDTNDFRLIRNSLEKPTYKGKLRIRCYGLADDEKNVFIEIKSKCLDTVYKRRVETNLNLVDIHLKTHKFNDQISKEIQYFSNYYNNLTPKVLLLYEREAYFGNDELRITFDSNIRYRCDRLSLKNGLDGIPILSNEKILMEIKTPFAIPLWLTNILCEEKIYKTSFSKYGEAYKNMLVNCKLEVKKNG